MEGGELASDPTTTESAGTQPGKRKSDKQIDSKNAKKKKDDENKDDKDSDSVPASGKTNDQNQDTIENQTTSASVLPSGTTTNEDDKASGLVPASDKTNDQNQDTIKDVSTNTPDPSTNPDGANHKDVTMEDNEKASHSETGGNSTVADAGGTSSIIQNKNQQRQMGSLLS